MRFMTIYRPADTKDYEAGAPPSDANIEKMGAFIEEMAKSGHLEITDGLLPSSKGAIVRRENGKITVKDGPFAEAKEIIGGFAIMRFDSLQDAIEMTKRFLEVAGDGESEVRQMYDQPAYAEA
jgi:hypothetical protein